jgi:gluconolactonase
MTAVREIATGLGFPGRAGGDAGRLFLVVEIERRALSRVSAQGEITPIAFPGGGPNGAAIGPDGKCYICNSGGYEFAHDPEHGVRPGLQARDYSGGKIERVDIETGEVELVYDRTSAASSAAQRSGFRPARRLLVLGYRKEPEDSRDHGAVCYAKADGSMIREVLYPMVQPNGVGLSPDERTLYVAETITGRLWAFDIVAPGEIAKKPYPSPNGGSLLAGLPGLPALSTRSPSTAPATSAWRPSRRRASR